jgi:hypothetical protein
VRARVGSEGKKCKGPPLSSAYLVFFVEFVSIRVLSFPIPKKNTFFFFTGRVFYSLVII